MLIFPACFVQERSVSDEKKTFIESLHEFGLLCNKGDSNAAFSPDGMAWVADVHLLANDLIVDVASPFAYDSSEDSEEGNQTTSNDKEAGKEFFLIRSGVHTSQIGISL